MRHLTATDQVYSTDWDCPHICTLLGFSTLVLLKREGTFWGVTVNSTEGTDCTGLVDFQQKANPSCITSKRKPVKTDIFQERYRRVLSQIEDKSTIRDQEKI